MVWIFEVGILLVVAVALRRVLHMGRRDVRQKQAPHFRRPANNPLCSPLASEIEGHTTILGVLLNDVIEEQNSGNVEVARRMLTVFDSERERLVELIVNLQNLSLKYLLAIQYPINTRLLNHEAFRSHLISDFVKRHGGLEQFIFRSKLRFNLQLRLMRRATALLNESFEELKTETKTTATSLDWALLQIDLYFHDLDLLAKETLLGFNEELAGLPASVRQEIATEISALTTRQSVLNPQVSELEQLNPPIHRS